MFGAIIGSLLALLPHTASLPIISPQGGFSGGVESKQVLSSHQFSLENRYNDAFVNGVFKKNILLTLAYIRHEGSVTDWGQIEKPFEYTLTLEPQNVLTYHNQVLPKYQEMTVPLTTVHFSSAEGFVSDGRLVGDGTCHLASLIAWTARDAGLTVDAPTNHDYAHIPDVPKEEGVSIYANPFETTRSTLQNFYITNTKDHPVTFLFGYDGEMVRVTVTDQ